MSDQQPMLGQICWNELSTPNLPAAKDFYGKVFGWEFIDSISKDRVYTMVKTKDKTFAGIWSIPKDKQAQIPPHWMAYILVSNLDESIEKARKNGATIVTPSTKAGEYGLFAIITDPTGAHIALWEPLRS
jgi:predicted enzyme related to lactoylglutathione lyase